MIELDEEQKELIRTLVEAFQRWEAPAAADLVGFVSAISADEKAPLNAAPGPSN